MEEIPLKEKIDTIFNQLDNGKKLRTSKLRLPFRAKIRKGRAKKGWIGILKINENGTILPEKVKIEDSSFQTKDGVYHATDGREKIMWQGKFPVIFQVAGRLNPINIYSENNETYGQKYVMARMLKDAIKIKNKMGFGIIIWIAVAIGLFFAAKYIFKF